MLLTLIPFFSYLYFYLYSLRICKARQLRTAIGERLESDRPCPVGDFEWHSPLRVCSKDSDIPSLSIQEWERIRCLPGDLHSTDSIQAAMTMLVRGIRGAITVERDEPAAILAATRELLEAICQQNRIHDYEEICSAIFTTTSDLTSTFPAEAARSMGMGMVPLLCATEIPVPGSMARCIRILLHVNTEKSQSEIQHVYLGEATKLRPDFQSAQ